MDLEKAIIDFESNEKNLVFEFSKEKLIVIFFNFCWVKGTNYAFTFLKKTNQ